MAILADARLMVMRLAGKLKPELTIAERTHSLDSAIDLLASPTILNAGKKS